MRRALLSLAGFAALWWAAVAAFAVPAFLLPAPPAVMQRLAFLHANAELWRHAATTVSQIVAGFVLGSLLGVLAGGAFARWPRLERFATPPILVLQTAPKIAIAPLLILWLGLGVGPKIVLVTIVVFFPAMTGALAGLRYVAPGYRDLAAVLKLTPVQRFFRIDLPFAAPPIAAGLRIGATHAVTAAVVAELMGANRGLGYLLSAGQESSDTAGVIGVVLLLAALGWGFHELVRTAERRLLSWHVSGRRAA